MPERPPFLRRFQANGPATNAADLNRPNQAENAQRQADTASNRVRSASQAHPAPQFVPSWKRQHTVAQAAALTESATTARRLWTGTSSSSYYSGSARLHSQTVVRASSRWGPGPQGRGIVGTDGYDIDGDDSDKNSRAAHNEHGEAMTWRQRQPDERRQENKQDDIEEADEMSISDMDVQDDRPAAGRITRDAVVEVAASDADESGEEAAEGGGRNRGGSSPPVQPTSRLPLKVRPFKRRRLVDRADVILSSPPSDNEDNDSDGGEEKRGGGGQEAGRQKPQRRSHRPRRRIYEDIDELDDTDDIDVFGSESDAVAYSKRAERGVHISDDQDSDNHDRHEYDEELDDEEDAYQFLYTLQAERLEKQLQKAAAASVPPSALAAPTPWSRRFAPARPRRPGPTERLQDTAASESTGAAAAEPDAGGDLSAVGDDGSDTGDALAIPPPDFFSPQKKQKRGRRPAAQMQMRHQNEPYVPGGMATELRSWLVQIKNGGGLGRSDGRSSRNSALPMLHHSSFVVLQARTAARTFCLAEGRPQNGSEGDQGSHTRLLLAGEGGANAQSRLVRDSVVSIAPPIWEVPLVNGQRWTVASTWAVE